MDTAVLTEDELWDYLHHDEGLPVTRRTIKHAVIRREIVPTRLGNSNYFSKRDGLQWVDRVCDTAFRNTRSPPTDSPTTRVTAANPRSGAENCRSQITSTNLPTGRRVGGSAGRRVGRYGPWPQPGILCKPRKPLGCGVRSVIVTRHRR